MEAGTKVTVTNKDGTTFDGEFVSTKSGWTVVKTKDGEKKVRSGTVAEKLTKAEQAKRDRAAAKAAKDAEKAAKAKDGEEDGRLVPADLSRYVLHDSKTASGRKHIDVDDEAARKMREKDLPGCYKYAAEVLGTTAKELQAKYQHLNAGMQRMNLGNRVRAAFKAAEAASAAA